MPKIEYPEKIIISRGRFPSDRFYLRKKRVSFVFHFWKPVDRVNLVWLLDTRKLPKKAHISLEYDEWLGALQGAQLHTARAPD